MLGCVEGLEWSRFVVCHVFTLVDLGHEKQQKFQCVTMGMVFGLCRVVVVPYQCKNEFRRDSGTMTRLFDTPGIRESINFPSISACEVSADTSGDCNADEVIRFRVEELIHSGRVDCLPAGLLVGDLSEI